MYIRVKRVIDIILSLIALMLQFPLFFILALWIKLDSKGPAFFRQKHQTKTYWNNLTNEIYKLRTMLTETPSDMPTHLLEDPAAFITNSGDK